MKKEEYEKQKNCPYKMIGRKNRYSHSTYPLSGKLYLLPILESHNMEYFKDFGVEHSLHDKIFINDDGYLETPTYRVPDCKFELKQPIQKIFTSKYDAIQRHRNNENILVSAETYKDDYVLNIAV